MLEKATKLCDAPFGQLATYDGEFFRYVAVRGDAHLVKEQMARGPMPASLGINWPRLVGGEDIVHIADVLDTDLYRSGHAAARRFVDRAEGRSLLSVALRREGALQGVLGVYRQEPRPFSDKQIALLQNFAAQAVVAMENARLLTETRAALEQQTATAEVLQVINTSPGDLAPVFKAILEKAHNLCEADLGVLRTFDGEAFPLVAICGHDRHIVEQLEQLSPIRIFGLLNPIVRGERVVHVADVRKTATYR